jgi:DNA polymerase III subunit gamma/tau
LEFAEYVKERKVWMSKDLQRADSAKQVGDELHIQFADPANCTLLRHKDNHKLLTEFALDFFQKELKVRFIIPEQNDNNDQDDSNSPQRLRQRLVNDPLVQMTVEIFGGQIGDIRVGPRSR